MPYRDPEKQKAYQREWQRVRKAGEPMKPFARTLNQAELRTAQGMLDVLADIVGQLTDAESDLFMKARTIAYVVSVGLRAVETAELERRLIALEERIIQGGNSGHKRQN